MYLYEVLVISKETFKNQNDSRRHCISRAIVPFQDNDVKDDDDEDDHYECNTDAVDDDDDLHSFQTIEQDVVFTCAQCFGMFMHLMDSC